MPEQAIVDDISAPLPSAVVFNGNRIAIDDEGYLLNAEDWSPALAEHLAGSDGLMLTDDHWMILRYVRDYFLRFQTGPMPRHLIKQINRTHGGDTFTIKHLYALFPDAPLRRACRYAGIPRPDGCS